MLNKLPQEKQLDNMLYVAYEFHNIPLVSSLVDKSACVEIKLPVASALLYAASVPAMSDNSILYHRIDDKRPRWLPNAATGSVFIAKRTRGD